MGIRLSALSKELIEVKCSNPACGKVFRDTRRNIAHKKAYSQSGRLYCSLPCANAVNVTFGGSRDGKRKAPTRGERPRGCNMTPGHEGRPGLYTDVRGGMACEECYPILISRMKKQAADMIEVLPVGYDSTRGAGEEDRAEDLLEMVGRGRYLGEEG